MPLCEWGCWLLAAEICWVGKLFCFGDLKFREILRRCVKRYFCTHTIGPWSIKGLGNESFLSFIQFSSYFNWISEWEFSRSPQFSSKFHINFLPQKIKLFDVKTFTPSSPLNQCFNVSNLMNLVKHERHFCVSLHLI